MQQNQSFGLLRFFERVGLLLLIGSPLVLIIWYIEIRTFPFLLVISTLSLAAIGFFVFGYTSKRIGHKIDLLASQTEFTINSQFLALFDRSPVPYIIVGDIGTVTKINQAAVQLLGGSVEDMMGANLLSRFADTEETDISIVVNKMKAGITLNDVEIPIKRTNDSLVWVILSSYTSPHNAESFISLVDITQAKKVDVAKSEF